MTENNCSALKLCSGVDLPHVGLGVWRSNPEETAFAVRTALQIGYRMFDTAAAYFNEAQVGKQSVKAGLPDPKSSCKPSSG